MASGLREIGYDHNIDMEIAHPRVEDIKVPGAIWSEYDYEPGEMVSRGYSFLKRLLKDLKGDEINTIKEGN